MCCIFAILILFGPRLGVLIWWLMRPAYFQLVFGSWVMPLFGLIFLPWTTLMYLIVAPGGITGLKWFWIISGLLLDIGSYSSSAYGNRDRIGNSHS